MSETAVVNFSVIFPQDKCCPGLILGTATLLESFKDKSCLNYSKYHEDVFPEISSIFVELDPRNRRGLVEAHCKESTPFYYCNGTMKARGGYKDYWEVAAFYLCEQHHHLDLMHKIDLKPDDETESQPHCEPLDKLSLNCNKYGQNITIPNMFGARSQSDARDMTNIGRRVLESGCHQHVEEFGCRSIYPECKQPGVLYPCRSMCEEVLSACGQIFEHFPVLDCKAYPTNSSYCFRKHVQCPNPKKPSNGKVIIASTILHGRAIYSCDPMYYMVGHDVRHCLPSGYWNGTDPFCEANFNSSAITLLIIALCGGLVLGITLFAMTFKSELQIFCSSRLGITCLKSKYDPSREHDVFVLFNFTDIEWVTSELVPRLENHCPPYNVVYQERDYVAGRWLMDCMEDAITSSKVCVAVVSQAFLDSRQDLYNFELAASEARSSATFKVIPILMEKSQKQGDVPAVVKNYLRVGKCLKKWSRWFWDTLFAEMPSKKTRWQFSMKAELHKIPEPGVEARSGATNLPVPPKRGDGVSSSEGFLNARDDSKNSDTAANVTQANRFSTTGPLVDLGPEPVGRGLVNGLMNNSSNIYYL